MTDTYAPGRFAVVQFKRDPEQFIMLFHEPAHAQNKGFLWSSSVSMTEAELTAHLTKRRFSAAQITELLAAARTQFSAIT